MDAEAKPPGAAESLSGQRRERCRISAAAPSPRRGTRRCLIVSENVIFSSLGIS
jgi:hypothetical protein